MWTGGRAAHTIAGERLRETEGRALSLACNCIGSASTGPHYTLLSRLSSRVATTTSSIRKIASPCSYLLSSWPRPSPSLGDHAHIPLIAHKIISNCPPVLKPTNNDWLVNSKLNQSVIRRVGKRTHVFTNGRKYSLDYNMDDEFVKAGYTFAGIVFASLSSC
jgi:hypothetical protein